MKIDANESRGLYSDGWLEPCAFLVLRSRADDQKEALVVLWNPNLDRQYEGNDVVIDEGSGPKWHLATGAGKMLEIRAPVIGGVAKVFVGSRFRHLIFDRGQEKHGREVGLRLHSVT